MGGRVIGELAQRHAGAAAIVIGGAPSRLTDIDHCPEQAIFFSANDHGCKQRACDYIVCCDQIEPRLRPWGIPIIAQYAWADYRVSERGFGNSAAVAAWAAWIMGCAPVIIIGVECYQGATYPDDPNAESTGRRLTLYQHLVRWELLKKLAPDGVFRAVSGPLLELFPRYEDERMSERC